MKNLYLKRLLMAIVVLCGFSFLNPVTRASTGCTNADLNGSFGFSISGSNVALGVPFALLGTFSADGQGKFKGNGTESVKGEITQLQFDGTYHVSTDCSGTAVLTFVGGIQTTLGFVIVDNGKEVLLMDTEPGAVETGSAKRIARPHDDKAAAQDYRISESQLC